jgi:hypothetical protein
LGFGKIFAEIIEGSKEDAGVFSTLWYLTTTGIRWARGFCQGKSARIKGVDMILWLFAEKDAEMKSVSGGLSVKALMVSLYVTET